MTIPGRGESVGEAYIRIFADGKGLDKSIRDEFKDNDKLFREQGEKNHESYRKGFDGEEKKDPTWAHLVGEMRKGKGQFDRVGQFLGSETALNFRKALEKELGDKQISDRIFRNISRDTLASGDIDHFTRSFRNLSPEIARASREIESLRLAEARTKNALKDTDDEVRKGARSFGALEKAMKFIEKTDFGKFFGQGSRNNFVNSFGNILGIAARSIAFFTVGTAHELGKVIKAFQSTGKEGESFVKRIGAVFGEGAGKILDGLGAVSAGILVLPLAFKLALGGVQLFIGPLVALIADLSAVIVALSSTIGFGLIGAVAPLLPLLGPLVFGFGAVALALQGIRKLSKANKAELTADVKPVIDQYHKLQIAVRDAFFGKNNTNVKELSKAATPLLKLLTPLLTGSAGAISKSIISFTKALSGSSGKSFLTAFEKFTPVAITKLGTAFTHTFLGIGGVLRNLIPFAQKLLDSLDKSTASFDRFTNSKSGQARMTKFFTGAVKSAGLLWTFLKDVGRVLYDILAAGKNTGDTLFGSINKSLETYDKYLNSPRGQASLKSFFAQVKPFLAALGTFVGGFGQFFKSLNNGQSQSILFAVLKGLGGLFSIIAKNIPTVIPLLKDFATGMSIVFRALGTVVSFVSQHEDIFRPIIVSLGALYIAAKVTGAKGAFGSIAGFLIAGAKNVYLAAVVGSNQVLTGAEKMQGAISGLALAVVGNFVGRSVGGGVGAAINVASGVVGGALAGFALGGPIGAGIGAAIGGIGSGIASAFESANKAAQKARAFQVNQLNEIAAAAQGVTDAIEASGDAYGDAAKKAVIAGLQKPVKGSTLTPIAAGNALGISADDIIKAVGGDSATLAAITTKLEQFNSQRVAAITQLQATLNADALKLKQDSAGGKDKTADQAKFDADNKALTDLIANTNNYNTALAILQSSIKAQTDAIRTKIQADDQQDSVIKRGTGTLLDQKLAVRKLSDEILVYGTDLSAATTAGQRNRLFIVDHTNAIITNADALLKQKGGADKAAAAINSQASAFINSATKAGYNKAVIVDLIDNAFKKIPPTVLSKIIADNTKATGPLHDVLVQLGYIHDKTIKITLDTRLFQNQISNIHNQLNDLHGQSAGATATGGRFSGAQLRLIAEAGPEAVVPLRRPLSQVDPSVRALSAYAQGIPYGGVKQMASGGVVGGPNRPTVIVESGGALFSTPTTDPQAVVSELMARMAMNVGN